MNHSLFKHYATGFLLLALAGCVQTLQVRDVIDLPPPEAVRATRTQGYITVTWRIPAAAEKLAGSGYNIYVAARSLATVPLEQLPQPFIVAAQYLQFTFAFADSAPAFIQMRTRAGRRQLSLPSVPEVIVPAASDSLMVKYVR